MSQPKPKHYHQENWELDPVGNWTLVDKLDPSKLEDFVDKESSLWYNDSITHYGKFHRIKVQESKNIDCSLRFIKLQKMTLTSGFLNGNYEYSRNRIQAQFVYSGEEYKLVVTDPIFEQKFLIDPEKEIEIGECYATISLSESYNQYLYKLVVSIIEVAK